MELKRIHVLSFSWRQISIMFGAMNCQKMQGRHDWAVTSKFTASTRSVQCRSRGDDCSRDTYVRHVGRAGRIQVFMKVAELDANPAQ
jgi:hypothetical protein